MAYLNGVMNSPFLFDTSTEKIFSHVNFKMEKACCNVEEKRDEGVPKRFSNTFNFPWIPKESVTNYH